MVNNTTVLLHTVWWFPRHEVDVFFFFFLFFKKIWINPNFPISLAPSAEPMMSGVYCVKKNMGQIQSHLYFSCFHNHLRPTNVWITHHFCVKKVSLCQIIFLSLMPGSFQYSVSALDWLVRCLLQRLIRHNEESIQRCLSPLGSLIVSFSFHCGIKYLAI